MLRLIGGCVLFVGDCVVQVMFGFCFFFLLSWVLNQTTAEYIPNLNSWIISFSSSMFEVVFCGTVFIKHSNTCCCFFLYCCYCLLWFFFFSICYITCYCYYHQHLFCLFFVVCKCILFNFFFFYSHMLI